MSFGGEFPRGVFEMEMSCFEPHLISYFPGDESVSRSGHHEFSGQFMSSQGFFLDLIKDSKSSFEGREEGFAKGRVGSRFIAIKEREW